MFIAEESWRRYLNGDQAAFDDIIHAYRNNLISFLYNMIHDPEAAEDLAEDALVELLVHPNRYTFKSSLKTYLFAIARFKAIDYVRKVRRHPVDFPEDIDVMPDGCSVESETLQGERQEMVRRALGKIKPNYAQALYLCYFENCSTDDIARVMHQTKKQVGNLLYRGKDALKNALLEEGYSLED